MNKRDERLATLRADLETERATPDRNACHARAIEREIEALEAEAPAQENRGE